MKIPPIMSLGRSFVIYFEPLAGPVYTTEVLSSKDTHSARLPLRAVVEWWWLLSINLFIEAWQTET